MKVDSLNLGLSIRTYVDITGFLNSDAQGNQTLNLLIKSQLLPLKKIFVPVTHQGENY